MEHLIESLEKQLEEAKQKFAESVCPIKIGDVITLNYTHKGKKAIVYKVEYKYGYKPKHGWSAYVGVLKNDGSESKLVTEIYSERHFYLESK